MGDQEQAPDTEREQTGRSTPKTPWKALVLLGALLRLFPIARVAIWALGCAALVIGLILAWREEKAQTALIVGGVLLGLAFLLSKNWDFMRAKGASWEVEFSRREVLSIKEEVEKVQEGQQDPAIRQQLEHVAERLERIAERSEKAESTPLSLGASRMGLRVEKGRLRAQPHEPGTALRRATFVSPCATCLCSRGGSVAS